MIASDSHSEALAAATVAAAKLMIITHLFLLLTTPFLEHSMCQNLCPYQIFTLDPVAHVGAAATLAHVQVSMALATNDPMAASHSYSEKGIAISTQNTTARMHHDFFGLQMAIWEFWLSQLWQPFPAETSAPGIPGVLPSEDKPECCASLSLPGSWLLVHSSTSAEVAAHLYILLRFM